MEGKKFHVIELLPVGDPGKPVVHFSLSLKIWEPGKPMDVTPNWRPKTWESEELFVWVLETRSHTPRSSIVCALGQKGILTEEESKSTLLLLFCSIWTHSRLDDAHPCCWGYIFFIQSANSNADLQKSPQRDTQTQCFTSFLVKPSQKWHRINHGSWFDCLVLMEETRVYECSQRKWTRSATCRG
jgi:hypothetical protein